MQWEVLGSCHLIAIVFQMLMMDDLDRVERGGQGEGEEEGDGELGGQGGVSDREPECRTQDYPEGGETEETHRRTFYKVVQIFGDKLNPKSSLLSALNGIYENAVGCLREDNPYNVEKIRNKIDLMKLNLIIERLENPINPLNVMNQSKRTTVVRNRVNAMALEVEDEGFLNEGEFLALHRKQENRTTDPSEREALDTEKKILDYIQKIADAKKLLKWPPPRFSLILIIVHLFLFFVTSSEGGRSVLTDLQFDP